MIKPTNRTTAPTKWATLADELRRRILSGALAPGSRLDSEKVLGEKFAMSRIVVRKGLEVLQNENLIFKVPGAGSFVSNHLKSSYKASDRIKRIGVMVDSTNPFRGNVVFMEIMDALRQYVETPESNIKFQYDFHRFAKMDDAFGRVYLNREDLDGCLWVPFREGCIGFLESIRQTKLPLVSFYRRLRTRYIDQIFVDHRHGTCQATEYLLRYGHRHILLVTGGIEFRTMAVMEREEGFLQAFEAFGVRGAQKMIVNKDIHDGLQEELTRRLQLPQSPTAMLIGGANFLEISLLAAHKAGRHIPQDLSVIAMDDSALAQNHAPPLTVAKQPVFAGVQLALRRLLHRIDYPAAKPESVALPPELILRASCRAYEHPDERDLQVRPSGKSDVTSIT